jgi:hypothetical protein
MGAPLKATQGSRNTITAMIVAACAAGCLSAIAYWPGLMSWDAVRQYSEALSGQMDDWHPPVMQWIWRQMSFVVRGPAPMLILQLILYWGGLSLFAVAFVRRGKPGLAWALLACGLCPLGVALTGAVLKDSLMTGALLMATGIIALRQERGGIVAALAAFALLCFAATLRFNAFTACVPLLVCMLPQKFWANWPRLFASATFATIAFMSVMPIANRVIGARASGVELSLVIFDLGGITRYGGVSAFPSELEVSNPVDANRSCYRPAKWDSYSDWVTPECPLGFTAWNDNIDLTEFHLMRYWIGAIVTHPLPYSQHRLAHFALSTRILPLADAVEKPVPKENAPNPWGFKVTPNHFLSGIDATAIATAHTPLGWPIVWIGAAIGSLIASWNTRPASLIAPIALSSIFYGCGYLVFGVAAELRYHLWTELAGLIAVVLVLGHPECRNPRRLMWAALPVICAVATATIGRWVAV